MILEIMIVPMPDIKEIPINEYINTIAITNCKGTINNAVILKDT